MTDPTVPIRQEVRDDEPTRGETTVPIPTAGGAQGPLSPGGPRRRVVVLTALVVAVALVAALVFVLVRPGGPLGGPAPLAGEDTSAGEVLDWGEPAHVETFDGPLGPQWQLYDGEGHVGNGIRTPDAITTDGGILRITGDSEGTTGGMAWDVGQKYGRWEGRVRAPASDETYNALLLLWPDAEDWPEGGEYDFMEMTDPSRQRTKIFLHYSEDDLKVEGDVTADGTQWHNWAMEWTPECITAYLDGTEWFRNCEPEVQAPRPMHLAIQLDWFPDQEDPSDTEDGVQESSMEVDWVKQYAYAGP
jgi:licheninase